MAQLRQTKTEIKVNTKEVDLAEVLKRIFDEAERNTDVIWTYQIPFFLKKHSSWLKKFFQENNFSFDDGEILFTTAELEEVLNRLVQTDYLRITLYEFSKEDMRVGFRRNR
mgnify:FL=1